MSSICLYLVRHGQTDYNIPPKRYSGSRTDISLNDTGRVQAADCGKQLADIKFDVVFCSPMKRAKETCEIIMQQNKYKTPIVADARLVERDLGEDYEGSLISMDFYTDMWDANKQHTVPKGGETVAEIGKRANEFLADIKAKLKGKKNVLVVAHGGINMMLRAYFYGAPEDGQYITYRKQGNCTVDFFEL